MRNTFTGSLINHQYVFVDSTFILTNEKSFIPAVWFGLASYPSRAWGCTVMLESGAIYRNLPLHAISFCEKPEQWSIKQSQRWDCYGWDWTIVEYSYLSNLDCTVLIDNKQYNGQYLFSVSHIGDGFTANPEQSKEFTFVRLNNNRLTVQPTNYILFKETSFTTNNDRIFPTNIKRQSIIYRCEQ